MKDQPSPTGTWKQFVETARRIISIPKAEIDRREAVYKRKRARLKKQRAKAST